MNREKLTEQIEKYAPFCPQEERDKAVILSFLRENEDAFERSNLLAHMTASAWVVSRDRKKVLAVYHKIYNSWSWTGGHADGETDLLSVALREVREETGVKTVIPLSDEIFSLEVLTVDGHEKRGQYVPSHLHLNITYLLMADEKEALTVCEDENRGVAWFSPEELFEKSTEPWFVERIYKKLDRKLSVFNKIVDPASVSDQDEAENAFDNVNKI